jgi:hypothetical protein
MKAGLCDLIENKFYIDAAGGDFLSPQLTSNYIFIDYIASTAGGQQYIDTGWVPD